MQEIDLLIPECEPLGTEPQFESAATGIGNGVSKIGIAALGIGVGAALMYLFDPDRGRGRRAKQRDQVTSKANQIGRSASSKARDLRNRAQGLIHEVSTMLPGETKTSNVAAD
jgi:hypothetical protein